MLPLRKRWPEGPFGFPMPERACRTVDALLRRLPQTTDHAYRHALVTRGPTELSPGGRCDVSWISTESVDRAGEVVLARGMDDRQFVLNPLVTLGHNYDLPPVGRSLWRRRVRDGDLAGIKAKTQYPPRPASWPVGEPWLPDQVFALVEAGLLRGKSIGFLPLRVHVPDPKEVQRRGWGEGVRLVVEEWLLLEYACVSLPANQHALVEVVSKGDLWKALGLDRPAPQLAEVERRVAQALPAVVSRAIAEALERARGGI